MADSFDVKIFLDSHFNTQLKALIDLLNLKVEENNRPVKDYLGNNEFQKLVALSRLHKTDYYLFNFFQQFPYLISAEQQQQFRGMMNRQAARSLQQLNELISVCNQ